MVRYVYGKTVIASIQQSKFKSPLTRLLLLFCREPGTSDYPMSGVHYDQDSALRRLQEVFPHIEDMLPGKLVIDFGCGMGYQAVALARAGADRVLGVEIADDLVAKCKERVEQHALCGKISIERAIPANFKADLIVSQNSFEHLLDAERVLAGLGAALVSDGRIYLTFAPPWFAPTGAHMGFFCNMPWVQLLFPESVVMEVRSLFRTDGARTYREAGLAQMSIAKFERIVQKLGFKMASRRYDCVRGLNFLQYIPVIRELAINRVSCILFKPAMGEASRRT